MKQAEVLTFGSLFELASLNGAYLIAWAWVFGMSVWISFFQGFISFRALPRHQFGNLQHKTFPVYFGLSIILTSGLLGGWVYKNPELLSSLTYVRRADVAQAYALGTTLLGQASNHFVFTPMATKIMFQRHKLEKDEGVDYKNPKASPEMKELSKKFGVLHGVSSLINLFAIIALAFHGLSIANGF
ncbi:hypothetical protein BKA70DRAFT_334593 [Coprinopsis sp. MPI-PUGE-AT-0042]|nr:hypothetical protein BKA70DRAFT_334593 [Coprinopsis sp. MPI-PUGE-AT-0042]